MNESDNRLATLLQALESELSHKPSDYRFTAAELGMIDQLHTGGYSATVDFARAVGITDDMYVLDVGCGFGGPARYLVETYGCRVEGVDVTPGAIAAAGYLSSRWVGPRENLAFVASDALSLPFPDATFDLVWMQHVAMNVADRDGMYNEIRRVLRPGGRLATYDVLRADGELIYPTPWAADARVSTVLTGGETCLAMERAGLIVDSFALDTQRALEWVRTSVARLPTTEGAPGARMMRAGLGENFQVLVRNLGKNYVEGRADVACIIARAPEGT